MKSPTALHVSSPTIFSPPDNLHESLADRRARQNDCKAYMMDDLHVLRSLR